MREQENPSTLDYCERRGGTGAELVQGHGLFGGEVDGILGQRSWHDDRPPDQARLDGIVICQDLAHVKPAAYLSRAVLRELTLCLR